MTTAELGASSDRLAQGRPLTHPAEGVKNHGWDNNNDDLIMFTGDVLEPPGCGKRYIVEDALGQGTFGQVVRCLCPETQSKAAVKIIKNQDAYFQQARVEIGILKLLGDNYSDRHNIVRLQEYFVFREHLCLVFELLDANLYDLLKRNRYRGLSIQLVWCFVKQLLDALVTLRDERIIHCDLKPENILLRDQNSGRVKVIDFGSACLEHKTVYSYIQSRFYRSPEVVVGYPYNTAIDMWSLGCVAAELFLGLPLFPAASERDLLARIMEVLGPLPDHILDKAKHNTKYYKKVDDPTGSKYQFLSEADFEKQNKISHPSGKRYFKHFKLADIIGAYPHRSGMSEEEQGPENEQRLSFTDFLLGVLDVDPHTRWTPHQAALHPFVRGEPFNGPFQPPPAPEPRGKSDPMRIQIPNPKTHGHSASWHPDPAAYSASFMNSPIHAEVQAQAHRAAMAAVYQLSPQVSPHIHAHHFSGSVPVGYGNPMLHSGPQSQGSHGVCGGSEILGRPIGDIRPPQQSGQMGFAPGLSPGTFGTPSTMFQSCSTDHQMRPVFNAAMAAAQAAVGSRRSAGGMSLPSSVRSQLIPPHSNQNGMHGDGQSGTTPIVGFTVPQSMSQISMERGDGIMIETAQIHNPQGTLAANFNGQYATPGDGQQDVGSLSFESLSVGGTGGEMMSAAQVSDMGTSFAECDDEGGEALSETVASNPGDWSDQDFTVGSLEVQGECNGPSGIRPTLPYPSVGTVARNDPHRIRNWHSVPYPACDQYQEPITSDSTSTCLGEMQQTSPSGGRQQKSYFQGDVTVSSQYVQLDETQRCYSLPQAISSSTPFMEPRGGEDLMRMPPPPGFSGARGGAQISHANFGGQINPHQASITDAAYVKRRSQTESFSSLPVLQENQPMVVREMPEHTVPNHNISPHHSGSIGSRETTWQCVNNSLDNYHTDTGLHNLGQRQDADTPVYPAVSVSNSSFISIGQRNPVADNSLRIPNPMVGSGEQDIRPSIDRVMSGAQIP